MPLALRIFTEPQQGATYDDLLAVAREAEELGFDAFFRSDHYLTMGDGPGLPGPTDAWVTLAGPGPRHRAHPPRHAGHGGHLPAARAAGHRRRAGRRHVRRPGRAGPRHRLVRAGARRLRHPVPAARRAVRPARGAARDRHRPVGDAGGRDVLVRRRPLPAHRLARAAQARAAPRPPVLDRRLGQDAHAPRWPPASPTSSTCRSPGSPTSGRRSTRCRPRARPPGATRRRCAGRRRWSCASARTRPRSAGGRPPSAASPTSCGRTARPAPWPRWSTSSARYAEPAMERIYLQVLDLHDLDHLRLIAAEVARRRLA